mgnify:CR=1 FL=1
MSEQNPQLINNLLEQQKTTTYAQQLAIDDGDNQLAVTRVVTAKYKVYVIILLILWVLLWSKYLPDAYAYYRSVQTNYQQKQTELINLKQKIEQLTQDKLQLLNLNKYLFFQFSLIFLHFFWKECSALPDNLKSNLWPAVSYLQMGNLSSEKMKIDEKKILKNLDQYLIKNNPAEKVSTPNGQIEEIEIWEPEPVAKDSVFFKLPIKIKVTFSDKDDLISFVDNIERFIIPNAEDRILYQIDEVSYDMMAYDETQTTEIQLSAYYFN